MNRILICAIVVICLFIGYARSGSTTVEFNVPDMMCAEGCGVATHDILAGQHGVRSVTVDFPSKTATVVASKGDFDPDKALAELIDHGFESSTIKTD